MTSLRAISVVVGSNVWISALVFGGEPRKVFERIIADGLNIVVSAELISEIRRVLTSKFPEFMDDFEALLSVLRQNVTLAQLGSITIDISRDADDNKVIETALLGWAGTIISGDKDLLVLGAYENISIITPHAWLEGLGK